MKLLKIILLPFIYFLTLFIILALFLSEVLGKIFKVKSKETSIKSKRGISVIIPTWNGKELLQKGLPALEEAITNTDKLPIEVIIVDNASSDNTINYLRKNHPTFKIISLHKNLRFAGACNIGAKVANYSLVYFLNNDMVVDQNFLLPLIARLEEYPDAFAIASQVIFADRRKRREETGKTYAEFEDGFIDLAHDVVDFSRFCPVLWAGGGAGLFNKEKFLKLGGFDETYWFYVEDLDISYRAWRKGWPVFYEPESRVIHHHRGTIKRAKKEEEIDRIIQRSKIIFYWKNIFNKKILLSHLFFFPLWVGGGKITYRSFFGALLKLPIIFKKRARISASTQIEDDLEIKKLSSSLFWYKERFLAPQGPSPKKRLNILILSAYSPYPPSHGGAVRMLNVIKQLSKRHNIFLLTFIEDRDEGVAVKRFLARYCKRIEVVLKPTEKKAKLFSAIPFLFSGFESPEMKERKDQILSEENIDCLQIDYTQMGMYVTPSWQIKNILTEYDLSFVSFYRRFINSKEGLFKKIRGLFYWLEIFKYEIETAKNFDAITTVSENDRELLSKFIPQKKIYSIPNGVDTKFYRFKGSAGRRKNIILFVGSFLHPPNKEGLLYFFEKIYPRIKRRIPKVNFYIVGKNPPEEILALAENGRGFRVTGFVRDIRPFYWNTGVFVVPIYSGSGSRIKILEAMSAGLPVVSTTIGCEGLEVSPNKDILVADDPRDFAKKTVTLIEDKKFRQEITQNARRLVETKYDWEKIALGYEEVYKKLF